MTAVTGIILAGGQARRMGGINKGLVEFRGTPLVRHVISRFAPQVDHLLLNANQELGQYRALGYPVIADDAQDFAGPLAGFLAGMRAATTPLVATVPCDSPFLPENLVTRLAAELESGDFDLAAAQAGGHLQPVFCLCKTTLRDDLAAFLQQGGRKVEQWQARHKMATVPFDDTPQAFANFNTREELKAAQ